MMDLRVTNIIKVIVTYIINGNLMSLEENKINMY